MFWDKIVRAVSRVFTESPVAALPELDDLEEMLIRGDVPPALATAWCEELRTLLDKGSLRSASEGLDWFRNKLSANLTSSQSDLFLSSDGLTVIMMVGVNGSGKTTTAAKLAAHLKKQGQSVLLSASDTFRAGAIEQLRIWGERIGVPVIAQSEGSDGTAVAFDAISAAKARNISTVIVDTAGRLHTKTPLMEELQKMKRVIAREVPGAPHEILLVVDGSTGQNGLAQADVFHKALGLTGIILSKYDGSARGGVILGIRDKLGLPIKFLGVGEKADNLIPFNAASFIDSLLAVG